MRVEQDKFKFGSSSVSYSSFILLHLDKSVASFFTPTSKKKQEPEQISWRIIGGSLVVGKYSIAAVTNDNDNAASENERNNGNGNGKRKVAVFDLVCWFGTHGI